MLPPMTGSAQSRAEPGAAPLSPVKRAPPASGRQLVLCVALAAVSLLALEPATLGLFHDDGLYVASARALAENGEYRLPSVPGSPLHTKFPPLYPLLLSAVWRVAPSFPDNIIWLKGVNVACVALTLLGFMRLVARTLGSDIRWEATLGAALLATAPGIALFAANQATADALFAALLVWILALATSRGGDVPRTEEALVAALVAAAILTRSVGVAVGVGLAAERAVRRRWGAAVLHGASTAIAFGGWSWWAAVHRQAPGGPLLAYYLGYPPSALGYLWTDPRLAASIVTGNLRMVASVAHVFSPALLVAGSVFGLLVAVGVLALAQRGATALLAVAATYLAAILVFPFTPWRYLVPLLPVACLAVVALSRAPRSRALGVAASIAVGVPLLAANVVWLAGSLHAADGGRVRGWLGGNLGYAWRGFEESFAWIRANTAPDARLATAFDPLYFLYTGRQGLRPWPHLPQTYFYPYDAPTPSVGSAVANAAELRARGVEYVVLDPPEGFAEGPAAQAMLEALVRLPRVGASLVFTSGDGRHRVYSLWGAGTAPRPRGGGP